MWVLGTRIHNSADIPKCTSSTERVFQINHVVVTGSCHALSEEMEKAAEQVVVTDTVSVCDLREVLPLMASLCDKVGNMDHNRDRACQCVMSLNEAFQ